MWPKCKNCDLLKDISLICFLLCLSPSDCLCIWSTSYIFNLWFHSLIFVGIAMENNRINIDSSIRSALTDRMSLSDLESVRLILEGNSIIDWNRANFRNNDEAEEFLRLHHFSLSNPLDVRRLKYLRESSIAYLEDQFSLRFPDDIKFAQDMRAILVMASQTGGFRRRQILCCVIAYFCLCVFAFVPYHNVLFFVRPISSGVHPLCPHFWDSKQKHMPDGWNMRGPWLTRTRVSLSLSTRVSKSHLPRPWRSLFRLGSTNYRLAGPCPQKKIIDFLIFRFVTGSRASQCMCRKISISAWLDKLSAGRTMPAQ